MADFSTRTMKVQVGPAALGTVHRRPPVSTNILTEDGLPLLTEDAEALTIEAA